MVRMVLAMLLMPGVALAQSTALSTSGTWPLANGTPIATTADLMSALGGKADTVSPVFTGNPAFVSTNAGLEIGQVGTSNTTYIDFHSGAYSTDFDVRMLAAGGTSSNAGGGLYIRSNSMQWQGGTTTPTVTDQGLYVLNEDANIAALLGDTVAYDQLRSGLRMQELKGA